jgi:NADH-quinone oxidoreductase subunit C
MTPDQLHAEILRKLGEAAAVEISHGLVTVDVRRGAWLDALSYARDALQCTFFDWLSAVDEQDEGVRVVTHLYSLSGHHHLLLRTLLPRDDPSLPSATGLFRGANWHERETHEMFGVVFSGHPGLDPLLLPDGFEGHPLRKDFVLASRVAKQWPGAVDPGESAGEVVAKRKRKLPPGVPDPDTWGPDASGEP